VRLTIDRLEACLDDATLAAAVRGAGTYGIGPLALSLAQEPGTGGWSWAVSNRGTGPVTLRSVRLILRLDDVREPLRILRNGWQSWSPSGVATLGVDRDPSLASALPFARDLYHADPEIVSHPDELRSEWVTVLADADPGGAPLLVGFAGAGAHDGTLRLRRDGGAIELAAEAFLGDVVLAPGERRPLHAVVVDDRPAVELGASERLARWASEVGRRAGARVSAPFQVGWCSWYHYFHDVSEDAVRANLARAADWPFDVFQLDDGYQHAIGDWLRPNARFPSGIGGVARAIAAAGRRPGLWIAPFLAAPDSDVARAHPDWVARAASGDGELLGMWNPPWGGGRDGWMYVLDTTRADVRAHLEALVRALVQAGFAYLKLDFAYAPALAGRFADPSRTPAERVRDGLAAIRRGAGDATFLLGCGAPLAPALGIVDGMRIGPDVAPCWGLPPDRDWLPGYGDAQAATRNAFRNTLVRAFMHRQLWLNDPDCLMLRTAQSELSPAAARAWAETVAMSGGMMLVSDDLALIPDARREAFEGLVAIGRASDAEAAAGRPARCPDLLDHAVPCRLEAAGRTLEVDPATATSHVRSGSGR
jgi:alpha-galactosidase